MLEVGTIVQNKGKKYVVSKATYLCQGCAFSALICAVDRKVFLAAAQTYSKR